MVTSSDTTQTQGLKTVHMPVSILQLRVMNIQDTSLYYAIRFDLGDFPSIYVGPMSESSQIPTS